LRPIPLLLALACAGGDGKDVTEPPPPQPLTVTGTVPAAGSQAGDPFAKVAVTFGAALDAATVTPAAFTVAAGATPLATTTAYDAASRTVQVDAPLAPGTTYQASVATSVRSSTGAQLTQAHQWTFATRPWRTDAIGGKRDFRPFAFARDAAGGLHRLGPVTSGTGMDMIYASCASGCESQAAWRETPLFSGNALEGGAVLVEGSNRRHVFFYNSSTGRLHYATCATGCDAAGGWQGGPIELSVNRQDGLDAVSVVQEPGGRLLVATVSWTGSGYGVSYGVCAANCATAGNWQYALIDPAGREPALAIDASGVLHLLFRRAGDSQLVYSRCATSCLTPASWQMTAIGSATASSDIAFLWTQAGLHTATNNGTQITYRFCAASCTTAASWSAAAIDAVSGNDRSLALVRAADGRLHLFYSHGDNARLKYASCTTGCTTAAGWHSAAAAAGFDLRNVRAAVDGTGAPLAVVDDAATNRLILLR
jgi:hypothetical protein